MTGLEHASDVTSLNHAPLIRAAHVRGSPSTILLVYSPNSMLLLLVFHGSLVNTRSLYATFGSKDGG